MKLMSFSLTTPQILARTKTVTRRMGWSRLKAGEVIQAVEKGMGLRKGQRVNRLALLRVLNVRREQLNQLCCGYGYGVSEIAREGFEGEHSIASFVEMFRRSHKGCTPMSGVTRIEFAYIDTVIRDGHDVDAATGEVLRRCA